jgi:hypothetical protein
LYFSNTLATKKLSVLVLILYLYPSTLKIQTEYTHL